MDKTAEIKRLQKLRNKALDAFDNEAIKQYDSQIAQLRKEIAAEVMQQARMETQAKTIITEDELVLTISILRQRLENTYQRGYREGQGDLRWELVALGKCPNNQLNNLDIKGIRNRGKNSWQIQFYTGRKINGKPERRFETIKGSQQDAVNRKRELRDNNILGHPLTFKDLKEQLKEKEKRIGKLSAEVVDALNAGRSMR